MMILFDIDDTLVNHSQAQLSAARVFLKHFDSLLPASEDAFCTLWDAVMLKHFAAFARGEISFIEHRRRRIREIFHDVDPIPSNAEADARFEVYLRSYEDSWMLFDDVLPCLTSLSRFRLGIISNGNTEQQKRKLCRLRLEDMFEVVVISEEARVAKPKPGILHEACRRASLNPHDCVYIGDNVELDALASQTVGMRAVWLNRKGAQCPHPNVTEITSLIGLPRMV